MIRTALDDIGAVLSLLLTLATAPSAQAPALQPPPCASRAALDDLLARSASAFNARDAVQGLALLRQAFDRATVDECVLERAEALRQLAIAFSAVGTLVEAISQTDPWCPCNPWP